MLRIHITKIINGTDVWGHKAEYCDECGCCAKDHYYPDIKAEEVEAGKVYLVDQNSSCFEEL